MDKLNLKKTDRANMEDEEMNMTNKDEENKDSKKKTVFWNYARVAVLTGAICFASMGGVSAYLTDRASATNEFTVGKVDIDLEEPNWKPEEQKKIEPGKVIAKDPQITNNGVNDAYVYLEVTIPIAEVEAASEDGTRLGKQEQELFSFKANKNWTRLSSVKKDNTRVYTYAYDAVLKPDATTDTLFDSLTFLNVIEGQLDLQKLEVPVKAYAIQASYTGGTEGTVTDKAKVAFEKYVNQNTVQDTQAAGN